MEKENRGGDPAAYLMSPENGKTMMSSAAAGEESDAGVDELLAALGYKVRSSDMADVAQKLEQLEMAMAIGGPTAAGVSSVADDNAILSHLASDTVHYNPSDISSWLESMLSEINAPPLPPPPSSFPYQRPYDSSYLLGPFDSVAPAESSTTTAAAAAAVNFPPPPGCTPYRSDISTPPQQQVETGRDRKRMRSSSSSSSTSRAGGANVMGSSFSTTTTTTVEASSSVTTGDGGGMPVVVVDTQEAGIRLVHALLGCAEAVQQENLAAADALLKQITVLAASQGGAMRKVAGCFAQALARRVYRLPPPVADHSDYLSDVLDMHFYESCPYIKFGHFTANQALLEAFAGHRRIHVVDFSIKQGMQWPALMQALALRPGGPPSFRLTGIGPPQTDNSDALQQVGWKLAQLAESIHIDFEFRGFVASSLADLEPSMLRTDPEDEEEVVAVNSIVELHRMLARPGALEKVLSTVRALKPRIFTVVEQEASHNAGSFVERFTEALHYYSTMFDSAETEAAAAQEQVMTEVYLGQQIHNVVACEGADRTERHETLAQWRRRFSRAGFDPVQIGSNAYKQASMLLSVYAGGDGYRVEEREGCLTLGWHTRPLIAASAWCIAGGGGLPRAALR